MSERLDWNHGHRQGKARRFDAVPTIEERQRIDAMLEYYGCSQRKLLMLGIDLLEKKAKRSKKRREDG